MYVCARLPVCLTVSSRRMLMRDRWPSTAHTGLHPTANIHWSSQELTRTWHKRNPTRLHLHKTSGARQHLDLYSLAVSSCPAGWTPMVALSVSVSCTQEWHITGPRTPGFPKYLVKRARAGLSSCCLNLQWYLEYISRPAQAYLASYVGYFSAFRRRGFLRE